MGREGRGCCSLQLWEGTLQLLMTSMWGSLEQMADDTEHIGTVFFCRCTARVRLTVSQTMCRFPPQFAGAGGAWSSTDCAWILGVALVWEQCEI